MCCLAPGWFDSWRWARDGERVATIILPANRRFGSPFRRPGRCVLMGHIQQRDSRGLGAHRDHCRRVPPHRARVPRAGAGGTRQRNLPRTGNTNKSFVFYRQRRNPTLLIGHVLTVGAHFRCLDSTEPDQLRLHAEIKALYVGFWLKADIQRPEIEVRFTSNNGHSGQGWECLKLTQPGLCPRPVWRDALCLATNDIASLLSWT